MLLFFFKSDFIYLFLYRWIFSASLCDFWTFFDVLLCTASILNLVAISIDRYFIIEHAMKYTLKRKDTLLIFMVICVWTLSAIISMPPLLGWGRASNSLKELGICLVSQDFLYQIYATLFAFYIPLSIMIFLYLKIYKTVQSIKKKEIKTCGRLIAPIENVPLQASIAKSNNQLVVPINGINTNDAFTRAHRTPSLRRRLTYFFSGFKPHSNSTQENQKAIQTLGIIMGCFIFCWLPFFILALIKCIPLQNGKLIRDYTPVWLDSLLLWFGYFNSLLNPIIYARFNTEFRRPFIEILCCRCLGINNKLRDAERGRYS